MIKEFEFYHGIVFSRILHSSQQQISIQPFPTPDNASYVLNSKVGIYIKYSTKRLSPWRFSFQKRHQDEINLMKSKLEEVFLLLVCKDDGIVCLSYEELKKILDDQHDFVEWISVARNRRQMYTVKGSNGKLGFKIGRADFPDKVLIKNSKKGILSFFEKEFVK